MKNEYSIQTDNKEFFLPLMKIKTMTTFELKQNFHTLIDTINNDNVLSKFYDVLLRAKDSNEGLLWSRLNENEQNELIEIERESQNPLNVIPHSEMMSKHKKWL